MKTIHILYVFLGCFAMQCNTPKSLSSNETNTTQKEIPVVPSDTISKSIPKNNYDILIIEQGFTDWLKLQSPLAKFEKSFLEEQNIKLVTEWNKRVNLPGQFDSKLYDVEINYFSYVDYGLQVNYKLYMYFRFFEERYNQKLSIQ